MNTLKHQQKKQSGDNHKASGKNVDKKCNLQNMQENKNVMIFRNPLNVSSLCKDEK